MAAIMERWHWTWKDFMELPTPTFFILLEELSKIAKKEEKAHKRAKRKSGRR